MTCLVINVPNLNWVSYDYSIIQLSIQYDDYDYSIIQLSIQYDDYDIQYSIFNMFADSTYS